MNILLVKLSDTSIQTLMIHFGCNRETVGFIDARKAMQALQKAIDELKLVHSNNSFGSFEICDQCAPWIKQWNEDIKRIEQMENTP